MAEGNFHTLRDGTVLDLDTGEIIEDGSELARLTDEPERVAWLATQCEFAKTQTKAWDERAKVLQRLVWTKAEGAKFETATSRVTVTKGFTGKGAKAEDALRAVQMELITNDELEALLIEAARDLDRATVEAWIARQDEARRGPLTAALIRTWPVAGHLRFAPILQDATR